MNFKDRINHLIDKYENGLGLFPQTSTYVKQTFIDEF